MPYSWSRLFWYYTGYYDSYDEGHNIKDEDVKRKQVLMKQITLSKLKLKKVNKKDDKVPFDLQKIEQPIKKENKDIKNDGTTNKNKWTHIKRGSRYNQLP
jgi:hypothetical protein